MPKIRVLVVEDSLTVRKRLVEVLAGDPDLEVVGEGEDGKTRHRAVRDAAARRHHARHDAARDDRARGDRVHHGALPDADPRSCRRRPTAASSSGRTRRSPPARSTCSRSRAATRSTASGSARFVARSSSSRASRSSRTCARKLMPSPRRALASTGRRRGSPTSGRVPRRRHRRVDRRARRAPADPACASRRTSRCRSSSSSTSASRFGAAFADWLDAQTPLRVRVRARRRAAAARGAVTRRSWHRPTGTSSSRAAPPAHERSRAALVPAVGRRAVRVDRDGARRPCGRVPAHRHGAGRGGRVARRAPRRRTDDRAGRGDVGRLRHAARGRPARAPRSEVAAASRHRPIADGARQASARSDRTPGAAHDQPCSSSTTA